MSDNGSTSNRYISAGVFIFLVCDQFVPLMRPSSLSSYQCLGLLSIYWLPSTLRDFLYGSCSAQAGTDSTYGKILEN